MCGLGKVGVGARTALAFVLSVSPLARVDAQSAIVLEAGASKTVSIKSVAGVASRSIFRRITSATITARAGSGLVQVTHSTRSVKFDVDEKAAGKVFELSVVSIHEEQRFDRRRRRWVPYRNVNRTRKIPVLVKCDPPARVLMNPGDRRELKLQGEAKFKRVLTGTLTKVKLKVTEKGTLEILAKRVGKSRARVAYVLGRKQLEIPVEVRVVLDRIPEPTEGEDPDEPDEGVKGEDEENPPSRGRRPPPPLPGDDDLEPDPQDSDDDDASRGSDGRSYSEQLLDAVQVEKSLDAVAVTIGIVPALRYALAKEYDELSKSGYEGIELEDKLRAVYKKNWSSRDKVFVTVELKRGRTQVDTHYFLYQKDRFLEIRQGKKLRFSRMKTSAAPIWETWKVFIYNQNGPTKVIPHKLLRLESFKQTFSVSKVNLDSKEPIKVTVQGIYRQQKSRNSFGSFKNSVDVPSRQISCSGFGGLRLDEEIFTFYPATWKLPKPPKDFESLLERFGGG